MGLSAAHTLVNQLREAGARPPTLELAGSGVRLLWMLSPSELLIVVPLDDQQFEVIGIQGAEVQARQRIALQAVGGWIQDLIASTEGEDIGRS